MHVVVYLPSAFYSAIASTVVETLQAVNDVHGAALFSFEFVAKHPRAVSKSGISFPAKIRPSKKMDVLILLAGLRPEISETLRLLDEESEHTKPLIRLAQRQGAVIASTCGAAYLLAASGLLDGKRSTISWWLKKEAGRRFPKVRWEPSRLIIRQGRIYTSGAAFSGLELITTLLIDLGFAKEERQVRKLMVLPPSRQFQSPYEMPVPEPVDAFEKKLNALSKENLPRLNIDFLAERFGMSPRTLSRRFFDEFQTSPGKWIQQKRLETARTLLEVTKLSISEVCYRVGYQDLASFSRLFAKTTGMPPGEFRKEIQG
ncbi:MAG TPA: helix-turn-helix domain-containing protein [Chthoniobacterales bacterium]|jgi:transcriptional regulator GlxA family with amidase domain